MNSFHDDSGWEQDRYEAEQADRESQIQNLYDQKTALLDKYGVFGGGQLVNEMHRRINEQLEAFGIDPTSNPSPTTPPCKRHNKTAEINSQWLH